MRLPRSAYHGSRSSPDGFVERHGEELRPAVGDHVLLECTGGAVLFREAEHRLDVEGGRHRTANTGTAGEEVPRGRFPAAQPLFDIREVERFGCTGADLPGKVAQPSIRGFQHRMD